MSTPLAGQVALSLPLPHGGMLYLAQVAWRRGDPLETTDMLLDSEPADDRTMLAVLDAVEETAKARAGDALDPHNAVLWQQAAQRVWSYAADYGDAWAAEHVLSAALAPV